MKPIAKPMAEWTEAEWRDPLFRHHQAQLSTLDFVFQLREDQIRGKNSRKRWERPGWDRIAIFAKLLSVAYLPAVFMYWLILRQISLAFACAGALIGGVFVVQLPFAVIEMRDRD